MTSADRRPDDRAPSAGRSRAEQVAAATPAHRDRYVDLLRATAILMVVLGHWVVAAVVAQDGGVVGVNLLGVLDWTHPLTWVFQVMPVVFLVGGFANAASWEAHRRRGGAAPAWVRARALRLLRPTVVLLVVLAVVAGAATLAGADPWLVRAGVHTAAMSLWFLVVYLAVVALAPALLAWHRRAAPADVVVLGALVVVGDLARLGTGSDAAAAGNYLAAWAAMHQLGVAWRTGVLRPQRRAGALLALGGAAALLALVSWGPYAVTMVGAARPPELGNTAPPTVALLALGLTQAGLVVLLRPLVEGSLSRPRVWLGVVSVNRVALTVYLWHMVPVVLVGVALVGTGVLPQPDVGSAAWFAWRVPWLAALGAVLVALVAAVGRWEHRPARVVASPPGARVGAGVVACLLALLGVGVGGPDGLLPWPGVPLAEAVALAVGMVALGATPRHER